MNGSIKKRKMSMRLFLFLLAFLPLVFYQFYMSTTFVAVANISSFYSAFRFIALFIVVIKIVLFDKYKGIQLAGVILLVGASVVSFVFSRYVGMLEAILLLVGAKGIDEKFYLSMYLKLESIFLVICFICSQAGIIIDYTTTRVLSGIQISDALRHSFGISYSTDFAAHVFYIFITYHYIKKRRTDFRDILIALVIVYIIEMYCNTRLSELAIIVSVVLFWLNDRHPELMSKNFFSIIVIYSTFVSGIFSMAITYFFDINNPVFIVVDEMLFSNRLRIGKKVLDQYGMSLFGQHVVMQGQGYKINGFDTNIGVTYLDNSYVQCFMLHGIILTIFFLIAYTLFAKKACVFAGNKLKIVIFLIAITSIINQYLISYAYNPFVILVGIYLLSDKNLAENRM